MYSRSFNQPPKPIELQLLRHSESESQLLSPLTDYLALCGDYPSATIQIPLQHRALQTRLRALDYEDSDDTRRDQIDELSSIVSKILGAFPGLATELSQCEDSLAHVSLATSAAELAMVPFELAMMPNGTAGAAQRMCLQPHIPVCLTRRSRNVNRPSVNWRRRYRVLMVASNGHLEVPTEQHYAVLRRAIEPWVPLIDREKLLDSPEKLEELLVLKVDPTIDELSEYLKREFFSHVHILAHGGSTDREGTRFGLVMRSGEASDGFDVVDGERLGSILTRPDVRNGIPLVVTLAACQSGRQGGIIGPGSSLAFELHNAGIPIVIGSQFPLSEGGSVVMARELYEGLLNGEDPRDVIWKTRCALYGTGENLLVDEAGSATYVRGMHDWASMIAFAQIDGEFSEITPEIERDRIFSRLRSKMNFIDHVAQKAASMFYSRNATNNSHDLSLSQIRATLDEFNRFSEWIDAQEKLDRRVKSLGMLASVQKRFGLILLKVAMRKLSPEDFDAQQQGFELLQEAQFWYDEVFRLNKSDGWALVQTLGLNLAFTGEVPRRRYETAIELSESDLALSRSDRQTWARGALAELKLQAIVHKQLNEAYGRNSFVEQDLATLETEFRSYLHELVNMSSRNPDDVRSGLLQLLRYSTDFIELAALSSTPGPKSDHAFSLQYLFQDEEFSEKMSHGMSDDLWDTVSNLQKFVRVEVEPLLSQHDVQKYRSNS